MEVKVQLKVLWVGYMVSVKRRGEIYKKQQGGECSLPCCRLVLWNYFRKTISRVISARVLAPHMAMVSASSPPILSMYSFTPSSAPP